MVEGSVAARSFCDCDLCLMYDLTDTIVAVSSASGGLRSIVRISGPDTLGVCEGIFSSDGQTGRRGYQTNGITPGLVRIDDDLSVEAWLYVSAAPHSYTGQTLAEIHLHASRAVVEALIQRLLANGLRPAGPGEFTARAYLNGKLDLAQAEAVNEIITSSNQIQLNAAEKLLSGRLTKAVDDIRSTMLETLSLIEAGLDFSGEDIQFISPEQAADRLRQIYRSLEELLAGSLRYEGLIGLPAIGIAGAPNAGKSSLLNALLGTERSIVSEERKTTRDVLSGLLRLPVDDARAKGESETSDHQPAVECVVFDCAGLVPSPETILDRLAQSGAVEASKRCLAVLFCVDAAKSDWSEDVLVRALIDAETVIHVATKADLLPASRQLGALRDLTKRFGADFLPTSAATGQGMPTLRGHLRGAVGRAADSSGAEDVVAMTTRHRQAVTEAIENIARAIVEINRGNEEVAAMLIRSAYQALAGVEQQALDEELLDRIFGQFCIGK